VEIGTGKGTPVGNGIVGMEKTKIETYFTTHNVSLFFMPLSCMFNKKSPNLLNARNLPATVF